MGCGTSRTVRVHPAAGSLGQQSGNAGSSHPTQPPLRPAAVQVRSIGVQTVQPPTAEPRPSTDSGTSDRVDVIIVQPVSSQSEDTTTEQLNATLREPGDTEELEATECETETKIELSTNQTHHNVEERWSQGSQTQLEIQLPHIPPGTTTQEGDRSVEIQEEVRSESPLKERSKEGESLEMEERASIDKEREDTEVSGTKDKVESPVKEGDEETSPAAVSINEGDSLERDRDEKEESDGSQEDVVPFKEETAVMEEKDDASSAVNGEITKSSVVVEQRPLTDTHSDTEKANTEPENVEQPEVSSQVETEDKEQSPESTTAPVDDTKTEDTASKVVSNPTLTLKPIPSLSDGLTVSISEPRLPLLPPIGTKKPGAPGGGSNLKSKSVSDIKQRQVSGEKGTSSPAKNKSKSSTTTHSRSSSSSTSLSKSRGISSSSENVTKKSTSRESLRSGSHTHLKSASSTQLHPKGHGGGLSSKKLSLSRESLKAASQVYASLSKSRDSLKPSKSRESLKSQGKSGSVGKKVEVEEQQSGQALLIDKENRIKNTESAPEQGELPVEKDTQEGCDVQSEEVPGSGVEEEYDDELEQEPSKEKETPDDQSGPKETVSGTNQTTDDKETVLLDHTAVKADKMKGGDGEGSVAETIEQSLETKFEIDHHTGQSEQSIVEAVEKSIKDSNNSQVHHHSGPAVQPVATTVQ